MGGVGPTPEVLAVQHRVASQTAALPVATVGAVWEERPGRIAEVRTVWRAEVTAAGRYPINGSEYWGISFIRRVDGTLAGELDGPTFEVHEVDSVQGERYWGVELAPWVTVQGLPKQPILGLTLALQVDGSRVRLDDAWWPVPAYDEIEAWVEDLVASGTLVVDREIRRALGGDRVGATDRTWQRRYRSVVGLTAAQVKRARRVEQAFALLQSGMPPAEAAVAAGFADQAHLTRSMRLIRGRTPASVLSAAQSR